MDRAFRLTIALLTIFCVGCSTQPQLAKGDFTTVVLVRHTERTKISKELTSEGRARAASLPVALADLDITAIYSPDLPRNLDSAAPLARQRGVAVTIVPAEPDLAMVERRLRFDHPRKTVVWVGNVGNLKVLHRALGGSGRPPVTYGAISLIQIPQESGGETHTTRRTFGD